MPVGLLHFCRTDMLIFCTFNALICACNRCSQPKEALAVYQKMLSGGVQPVFTSVMLSYLLRDRLGILVKGFGTTRSAQPSGSNRQLRCSMSSRHCHTCTGYQVPYHLVSGLHQLPGRGPVQVLIACVDCFRVQTSDIRVWKTSVG